MRLTRLGLCSALIGAVLTVSAQPAGATAAVTNLDNGEDPASLVAQLLGPGVSVSNVTYTGANEAAGIFSGGGSTDVGFADGITLSTGDAVADAAGPNTTGDFTLSNGQPGDADLNNLVSGFTQDAAILEFDFVVTAPTAAVTLAFQYVFGSEEYNEWVYSSYDDVFGFFVDGTNCATVGDPPQRVSINTINNDSNGDLFIDNTDGHLDIQLDGLTTVLTCEAVVTSGDTHHMKLAIADRGDSSLDSAVYLKANSFTFVQQPALVAEPSIVKVLPGNTLYFPNLTGRLTAVDGTPVSGQTVSFSVGGAPACSAVTNDDGVATCAASLDRHVGSVLNLGYEADFAGAGPYLPVSDHGPLAVVAGTRIG